MATRGKAAGEGLNVSMKARECRLVLTSWRRRGESGCRGWRIIAWKEEEDVWMVRKHIRLQPDVAFAWQGRPYKNWRPSEDIRKRHNWIGYWGEKVMLYIRYRWDANEASSQPKLPFPTLRSVSKAVGYQPYFGEVYIYIYITRACTTHQCAFASVEATATIMYMPFHRGPLVSPSHIPYLGAVLVSSREPQHTRIIWTCIQLIRALRRVLLI